MEMFLAMNPIYICIYMYIPQQIKGEKKKKKRKKKKKLMCQSFSLLANVFETSVLININKILKLLSAPYMVVDVS